MEHLNKQQVILVCLLVAIVTSISTGIITVSLLDKASEGGVSQTIYQVIERTVERVVPDTSPVKKIIEKEQNTAPKELPLAEIAEKAGKSVIRIYRKDVAGELNFVTIAVAMGEKGALIGPKTLHLATLNESLVAVNPTGEEVEVSVAKTDLYKDQDVFLIKDTKNFDKVPKIVAGNFSLIKLGSNIVAFGGKEKGGVVSTGIISEFKNSGDDNATTTAKNIVVTNINLSSTVAGFVLLDTYGNIVGFATSPTLGEPSRFFDASVIRRYGGDLF